MIKAFWLILSGVAIGILIAPDKGSETWKKILNQLSDSKNETSEDVTNVMNKGKDLVIEGLNRVEPEVKYGSSV